MAGIPWYRSITAITALVVMSEAGLLGVLVLVPRLFEVDALSSATRLLLVILPIVYVLVGVAFARYPTLALRSLERSLFLRCDRDGARGEAERFGGYGISEEHAHCHARRVRSP